MNNNVYETSNMSYEKGMENYKNVSDEGEILYSDSFYGSENIAELEKRINDVKNGKSTLKEHELIEIDDE